MCSHCRLPGNTGHDAHNSHDITGQYPDVGDLYPGIVDDPPMILAPMLEEVPLPSIPVSPRPNNSPSNPDYHLNYFSMIETYHPEYFEDLPSEIMNHFRTSTVRPVYNDPPEEPRNYLSSTITPVTCSDGMFVSPCNPHLPRFSLSDLSRLAMQGYKMTSVTSDTGTREPSQLSPPSGRVPYPTFRPEYEDMRHNVTPLMYTPRQYVPSSTIRPHMAPNTRNKTGNLLSNRFQEMDKSKFSNYVPSPPLNPVFKITTYRPKFSLTSSTVTNPSDQEFMDRIKERLTEIINKLREKERSGNTSSSDTAVLQNWYQQRRKNGQRYYPDNDINPHLPVTSTSSRYPESSTSSYQPNPDDYFTVKDRKINGAGTDYSGSGCLLLCIVIMHTIML